MGAWITTQESAGRTVQTAWRAVGEAGALERTTDRNDGSVSYTLHAWIAGREGEYAPQSRDPAGLAVEREGRYVPAWEALDLIA
jgi:hypothetical protein